MARDDKANPPRKFMYHPEKAPAGQVFDMAEAPKDGQDGWVDTPAKFKAAPAKGKA